MKKAVIIGVSSQDGSYLADFLLEKGYEITGTVRRSTHYHHPNIEHLYGKIRLQTADLLDGVSLDRLIKEVQPDEVYNLGAQSVPADSWTLPIYTGEVTALGAVRVFEAVRNNAPHARVYQATTREILGNIQTDSADESTPIDANNPYGIAKAYAHMMVNCYRESYGIFVCGAIMFNHESPRRSLHFVTRKISAGVACIKNNAKNIPLNEAGEPLIGNDGKLHVGGFDYKRDWGYAKEYVEVMWLMLQQKQPKDYVIGTNTSYSVGDALRIAFDHVGLDWKKYAVEDKKFFRPTEIKKAQGNYALAEKELGWKPKTSFEDLMKLMVDADLKLFK